MSENILKLNWRSIKEQEPEQDQECLTVMKHGIILGSYDVEDKNFYQYYYRDTYWYATHWIPIEELNTDYYDMYYNFNK